MASIAARGLTCPRKGSFGFTLRAFLRTRSRSAASSMRKSLQPSQPAFLQTRMIVPFDLPASSAISRMPR